MGRYLNLTESDADEKCLALAFHGAKLQKVVPLFAEIPKNQSLICVGDQNFFQYTAVVYDEREYEEFTSAEHTEHQMWFLMDSVKVDELLNTRERA